MNRMLTAVLVVASALAITCGPAGHTAEAAHGGHDAYLDVVMEIAGYQRTDYPAGSLIMLDVIITNNQEFVIREANYRTDMAYADGETFVRLGGPDGNGATKSYVPQERHTIIADNRDIDLSPDECTSYDGWRSIPPGSAGLQRLCYWTDTDFEPDGLRIAAHSLLHGLSASDNRYDAIRLVQVVPFEAESAYCAVHQRWCNTEMIQPISEPTAPPGADPPEPTHTVYNVNTGTLTIVFGEPIILVNQSRIGITTDEDDAGIGENGTLTTLAGAEVSTISNSIMSWVFAFTLPEETSRMISGELDEYGSALQVLIDTKAMYATNPVADLTDRNGGLPLVIYDVPTIR